VSLPNNSEEEKVLGNAEVSNYFPQFVAQEKRVGWKREVIFNSVLHFHSSELHAVQQVCVNL